MTLHHDPPTQTQSQQYLSCYWPDFDETLKVGSWEHLEQTLTVTGTFVQATFVPATFVHIRNISTVTDLILMKLSRCVLRTSRTGSNCHCDICPGNICLGDICPYPEYLSSYWSDFHQTLKPFQAEHFRLSLVMSGLRLLLVLFLFLLVNDTTKHDWYRQNDKKKNLQEHVSEYLVNNQNVYLTFRERIR